MTHEYNTRSKMVDTIAITQEDLRRLQQNIIDSLKDEIINGNSSLKDEINNLKDTVIKRLQEENQNLQQKCNKLEEKSVKLETEQNYLAQYGRRNNIPISGIPDSIDDNNLENTAILMMSDINKEELKKMTQRPVIDLANLMLCQNLKRRFFVLSTRKIAIKLLKIKRNLQN